MDLTEYAPIFMFLMFGLTIVFACIAYKAVGARGIGITCFLFAIGTWIALGIANANDYRDASPEMVTTLLIGSLSLNFVYGIYNLVEIIKQKQYQIEQKRLEKRRHELKKELAEKEACYEEKRLFIGRNQSVINVLTLMSSMDNKLEFNSEVIRRIIEEDTAIRKLKKEIEVLQKELE